MSGKANEVDGVLKFLVLEGVSPSLRARLVQNKVAEFSVGQFQQVGVVFQNAHGRRECLYTQSTGADNHWNMHSHQSENSWNKMEEQTSAHI